MAAADAVRVLGGWKQGRVPDAAAAFGLAFSAYICLSLGFGANPPWAWDADGYWELPKRFVVDGSWSLLNFDSDVRGYFPGLVFGVLRWFAELGAGDELVVKVFNSALLAAAATVLLPALAAATWPRVRFGLIRRLVLALLLAFFYGGYLDHPLTDLPSMVAALLALIVVCRRREPGWLLLAGIAAGVAVNCRPAYIAFAVGLIALAYWPPCGMLASHRRRLLDAFLVLAGFGIVALPQAIVAERHVGQFSLLPGAGYDLANFQLTTGLALQRYDTYVGPGYGAPIRYLDPIGNRILAKEGITDDKRVRGYGDYLGIIVRHPLDMAGVFVRRVANGLDQRYSTVYVERLDTGQRRPWRILGFLVLTAAFLRVVWPAARKRLGSAWWRVPVVLALSVASSVPSAVEQRFMLPLFCLALVFAIAGDWPRPWQVGRWRETAAVGVTAASCMVVLWYVAARTTDNLLLTSW